jgi:hypothetical protein
MINITQNNPSNRVIDCTPGAPMVLDTLKEKVYSKRFYDTTLSFCCINQISLLFNVLREQLFSPTVLSFLKKGALILLYNKGGSNSSHQLKLMGFLGTENS